MNKMPCTVCCLGFCRDRDLIMKEEDGKAIWSCESNSPCEEIDCGFEVPADLSQEEIRKKALERIRELQSRGFITRLLELTA